MTDRYIVQMPCASACALSLAGTVCGRSLQVSSRLGYTRCRVCPNPFVQYEECHFISIPVSFRLPLTYGLLAFRVGNLAWRLPRWHLTLRCLAMMISYQGHVSSLSFDTPNRRGVRKIQSPCMYSSTYVELCRKKMEVNPKALKHDLDLHPCVL